MSNSKNIWNDYHKLEENYNVILGLNLRYRNKIIELTKEVEDLKVENDRLNPKDNKIIKNRKGDNVK